MMMSPRRLDKLRANGN
jgi:hypothetical protein